MSGLVWKVRSGRVTHLYEPLFDGWVVQMEVVHSHTHCLQSHTYTTDSLESQANPPFASHHCTLGNILSRVPSTERRPEEGRVAALATYCTVRSCTANSPSHIHTYIYIQLVSIKLSSHPPLPHPAVCAAAW